MSDDFESLFHRLRGQRPPHPFAVPEAIRRRGRQRSQHQALAAGLTVVALVAGTGWAATFGNVDRSTDPGPASTTTAPTVTRSPAPLPTRTPPAASASPSAPATRTPAPVPSDPTRLMLRPEDLGPGTWRRSPPYEPFAGDIWAWDSSAECPAYRTADYPSLRQQVAVETDGWATGSSGPYLHEHVHRYRPGWGPRALDDVRRVLATCPGGSPPPRTPGGPVPSRLTIVDKDFAGDESLLVRREAWVYSGETIAKDPFVTLIAAVRVGDLVATVLFSPDRDEQYARTVATAAGQRLAGG